MWLNRDPLGDDGSLIYGANRYEQRSVGVKVSTTMRSIKVVGEIFVRLNHPFEYVHGSLFGFVLNDSVNRYDPRGLYHKGVIH